MQLKKRDFKFCIREKKKELLQVKQGVFYVEWWAKGWVEKEKNYKWRRFVLGTVYWNVKICISGASAFVLCPELN